MAGRLRGRPSTIPSCCADLHLSTALPSLALAAEVSVRRQAEGSFGASRTSVVRVRSRTAELAEANRSLYGESTAPNDRGELSAAERASFRSAAFRQSGKLGLDIARGTVTWSDQLYGIMVCSPASSAHLRTFPRSACTKTIATASVARSPRPIRPVSRSDWRTVCGPTAKSGVGSSGEVIRDDRGNAVRMLGICQDVTEQNRPRRRCGTSRTNTA